MRFKTRVKKAWTAKNAPLVETKSTAEVALDGKSSIPLQEMANRHVEAGGYKVTREFFDKKVDFDWTRDADVIVPFMRVTIENLEQELPVNG